MEPVPQLQQQGSGIRPRPIHLIDEQKRGDPVLLQQLPQRLRVPLDAVRAADDQHRIVQHPQGALHLRGKIRMPRRIQQRHVHLFRRKFRHLGKDGDAPLPLQRVRIQKSVPVIHPSQFADAAALVEQRFRQSCFSRIHVGQDAQTYMFSFIFFIDFNRHKKAPSMHIFLIIAQKGASRRYVLLIASLGSGKQPDLPRKCCKYNCSVPPGSRYHSFWTHQW